MSTLTAPTGLVIRGKRDSGGSINGMYLTHLQGLDDGVDDSFSEQHLPLASGYFDTPGFLNGRVITADVKVIARSKPELLVVRDRLIMASGTGTLVWDAGAGRLLHCEVRKAQGMQWIRNPTGLSAQATLQWRAADPRLYGTTRVFSAGDPLFHRGNTASNPVIQVTGNMPGGYKIQLGSAVYQVTANPTTATHEIDMRTGILTVGGVLVAGVASSVDLWSVPAGGTVSPTFTPAAGSGSVTYLVTDTYL